MHSRPLPPISHPRLLRPASHQTRKAFPALSLPVRPFRSPANRGKPHRLPGAATEVTHPMSKQQKSNREIRKPKKEKPKTNASNPSVKTGVQNVFDQRKK